jgi:hypothetical protein
VFGLQYHIEYQNVPLFAKEGVRGDLSMSNDEITLN